MASSGRKKLPKTQRKGTTSEARADKADAGREASKPKRPTRRRNTTKLSQVNTETQVVNEVAARSNDAASVKPHVQNLEEALRRVGDLCGALAQALSSLAREPRAALRLYPRLSARRGGRITRRRNCQRFRSPPHVSRGRRRP